MEKIPFEKDRRGYRKKAPEGQTAERIKELAHKMGAALSRMAADRSIQKRIIAALLAVCIGTGLGEVSRRYGLQKALEAEAAMYALRMEEAVPETAVEEETVRKEETEATTEETEPEEKPYEPSPDRLNLAYYYPEDSDGEDIIDSYAGEVFQELTIRDSEWLADIYELADIRPAAMAARMGRDPSSVLGRYDPENEAHDPDDPSTWSVDNWKQIHVSFIDGDGRTSTSCSNVKEILAMASVYTYHTDVTDVEAFRTYAAQLWAVSRSCFLSMGDVYYCDGCVDKTDEEIAREAIEAEEGAAAVLAGREATGSGGSGEGGAVSEGHCPSEGSPSDRSESGSARDDGSSSGGREDAPSGESSSAIPEGPGQADATAKTSLADSPSPEGMAEGSGQEESSGETVKVIRRTKKATGEADQTGGETAGAEASAGVQESLSGDGADGGQEQPIVIRRTQRDLETTEPSEETALATDTDAQPAGLSGEGAAASDGQEPSGDRRSDCPGHVDLYIEVRLLGLEGKNSLIAKDRIGNAVDQDAAEAEGKAGKNTVGGVDKDRVKEEESGSWEGWTEAEIAHVRTICEQDWFADYGLSISSISLSTPLSDAEIEGYMDQLPEDLSEMRKKIVRFALSSVGRVPYYWGGKASRPGYEGNNFGALISSDNKGRILKGLDCSGWVSWVYWSVTGEQLQGSSTSGLILCGEKISRSELKPGDIIVRTGANAHVVMFLSWSANGQMNVIHESSASVNNVTIKTMDAAWPYYRRLVE